MTLLTSPYSCTRYIHLSEKFTELEQRISSLPKLQNPRGWEAPWRCNLWSSTAHRHPCRRTGCHSSLSCSYWNWFRLYVYSASCYPSYLCLCLSFSGCSWVSSSTGTKTKARVSLPSSDQEPQHQLWVVVRNCQKWETNPSLYISYNNNPWRQADNGYTILFTWIFAPGLTCSHWNKN